MKIEAVAHIAIAVPNLEGAQKKYQVLGLDTSDIQTLPAHGVRVCFIKTPNLLIELLEPLDASSPIQKFLEKNVDGGLHHICFKTPDINVAQEHMSAAGCRVLGDGIPKLGSHDLPVFFVHPKDLCGVLVEFEETERNLAL